MRKQRRVLAVGVLAVALTVTVVWLSGGWAWWTAPELTWAVDATTGRAVVGRSIHVSSARPDVPHHGCTIAADPSHLGRLFVASNPQRRDGAFVIAGYCTHDGGQTWEFGCERVGRSAAERCCDEAVAFGPNGDLVLAHMRGGYGHAATSLASRIDCVGSPDGGKTWVELGALDGPLDRPQLAFDLTGGRHAGRLYCNACVFGPGKDEMAFGKTAATFYASGDAGKSFTAAGLPDDELLTSGGDSNPVVLADGTVVVAYAIDAPTVRAPHRIAVWRSKDGGVKFASAGRVPTCWRHRVERTLGMVRSKTPRLAAAPAGVATSGRLYCVWDDGPFVLFSTSNDQGDTWTAPTVLSEQMLGASQADRYYAGMPAVAVNGRGEIAVAWFDRREQPTDVVDAEGVIHMAGYDLRLRASTDGGRTWLPSVRVNERSGRGDPLQTRFWGAGLAADAANRFHLAWVSDSDGVQQLWSAPIIVESAQ